MLMIKNKWKKQMTEVSIKVVRAQLERRGGQMAFRLTLKEKPDAFTAKPPSSLCLCLITRLLDILWQARL